MLSTTEGAFKTKKKIFFLGHSENLSKPEAAYEKQFPVHISSPKMGFAAAAALWHRIAGTKADACCGITPAMWFGVSKKTGNFGVLQIQIPP